MLRSFNNFPVNFEQVALLECLEPEEVVVEVSTVIQFGINRVLVGFNNAHKFRMN